MEFICYDGCNSCCTITSNPLTIGDLARISDQLGIKVSELFEDFCILDIEPFSSAVSFPRITIKLPCKFLKARRCSIYPFRPLICRIFPEDPAKDYSSIRTMGFKCIDVGFSKAKGKHREEMFSMIRTYNREVQKTVDYFKFKDYPIRISNQELDSIKLEYYTDTGMLPETNERGELVFINEIEKKRYKTISAKFISNMIEKRMGNDFSHKIKKLSQKSLIY